jgi:hypothetical protein
LKHSVANLNSSVLILLVKARKSRRIEIFKVFQFLNSLWKYYKLKYLLIFCHIDRSWNSRFLIVILDLLIDVNFMNTFLSRVWLCLKSIILLPLELEEIKNMLLNIFMLETGWPYYRNIWYGCLLQLSFMIYVWIRYIDQMQRLPGLRFHGLTCTLKSQVQI